jgi:hypothetical protein
MSKEQQELLDSAYENWKEKGRDFWEEQVDGMFTSELGEEKVDKISKECFINKCKTDPEFSERWGLKIEERELSDEESIFHYEKELYSPLRIIDPKIPVMLTKLITITYNDKTIESYE